MSVDPLRHLGLELEKLEQRGLLRERSLPVDELPRSKMLDLCSNDYLGYRSSGRLASYVIAAAKSHPIGAGASRLVAGEHAAHAGLEADIAAWLEMDESIVFTSGYAANVGTIAALAEEGDLVVSDSLNHASIIDGCRLSRATCFVAAHNAPEEVRDALRRSTARRRWVVTESYFSMDGDGPDLVALRSVCDELDAALVVDEAHAIGVLGPGGRGRAYAAGVRPDVLVGTLGKALAAQGAFVAGSGDLCRWLWNRARSFVFSTGLSPLVAEVGRAAVGLARNDDEGRDRLRYVESRLRSGLSERGIGVVSREGPILPVILGSEAAVLSWSHALASRGVLVQAIRPPTVPAGSSRLRLTARANFSDGELERALAAFAGVRASG